MLHTSELDDHGMIVTEKQINIIMPRCTVHRRHTVVRSCVGLSVPRFLGLSDFAYLCER